MTFIDKASRWTEVYPIKFKIDVFEKFKVYRAFAKRHTGRRIKLLYCDGGGEYSSLAFENYLLEKGIKHFTTNSYTPQQNGIAERMNRTLLNMVRSMLNTKQVEKQFWADAIVTSSYIKNRITTRTLPNSKTPYHIWYGKVSNISSIRVFGSMCWYKIPHEKLRKLDDRAHQAMLIGYPKSQPGYKLWDFEKNKVIISRDVTFNEEKCPSFSESSNAESDNVEISLENKTRKSNQSVPSTPVFQSEHDTDIPIESSDTGLDITSETISPSPVHRDEKGPTLRSARVRKAPGEWWKAAFAFAAVLPEHDLT